jgi:indolepyruvate ferredoxin oxidoreductase
MDEVLVSLKTENHALAVKMANVTEQIKGFGHVKEKHLAAVMVQWQNCMDVFRKAI